MPAFVPEKMKILAHTVCSTHNFVCWHMWPDDFELATYKLEGVQQTVFEAVVSLKVCHFGRFVFGGSIVQQRGLVLVGKYDIRICVDQ